MENNDYKELYHHGVKGQKWGVRRMNEKLQIQKKKTQLAELKALESVSKRESKEAKQDPLKVEKKINEAKRENGRKVALGILTIGTLGALTIGSLIKRERKTLAKGSVATKKILKKGGVTRRSFHY